MPRRRATKSSKPRTSRTAQQSRRVRTVWLSLVGSMTAVGGLLLVMDGSGSGRSDGLTLQPLAAATRTPMGNGLESVFTAPSVPVKQGRWTSIVIHHSGEPVGSAQSLSEQFRAAGHKGLGHHFIIGNGRGMDNGELHVGYRWLEQLAGAHAAGPQANHFNATSISICLVGDGDRQKFTTAQIARMEELVSALCRQLGISPKNVHLHRDIAPGTTDPGQLFPEARFRQSVAAR